MKPIDILESELLIPVSSGLIFRNRLASLADKIAGKKLTTIIAGSGYGKTILAAQTFDHASIPAVWYRLDESDRDLTTFIRLPGPGISKAIP